MGKPLRVLIVEDSEDDALLLLRDLRRGGYEPQAERVETAQELQAALDRQPWDIVLSDYSLPEFDAPAALAVLQATGLDIPFIISSGTIGEDVAVASLKAGANDFVVKNNNARLIPAIERELRDAESRRQRRKAEAELNRKSLFIEVLQEIAVAANEAKTTDSVLQFAVDKVCAFMGWPVGHVYLADPNGGVFVSSRIWHLDSPGQFAAFQATTERSQLLPHIGLIGRVVDRRQTIWIEDFTEDGEFFTRAEAAVACGLVGALAFPVLASAEIVAILEFFTTEVVEIDQPLLDVTSNIGTQLGQVFERQRNEAALRRYTERLQTLHRIDRAILTMQSPEQIAQFVLGFLQQQILAFHVSVALFDYEAQEAEVLMAYSQQTNALAVGDRFSLAIYPPEALELLRTGHRYIVEDVTHLPQTDPTVQMLQADGLRAWVWIPLLAQTTLIGTLSLGSRTQSAFTTEQMEIAHEIADQLAIGIQQARYQDQIRRHNAELEQRVLERTAELSRTKDRIEAILNGSSDALILTTFDGVIQQVNPAFDDLLNYSIDDMFGHSLVDLAVAEDVETVIAMMRHIVTALQPTVHDLRVRRQDGSTLDVSAALAPIMAARGIRGMVCSLRDVTERKQIETALKESEQRFRMLFEFAPEAYYLTDLEGTFLDCNRAAAEMTGYPRELLIGSSLQSLKLLSEDQFLRMADMLEQNALGNPAELDGIVLHPAQSDPITVEIRTFPTQIQGKIVVLGIARDISLHKKLEEELRQALVKEQELGELRTRFVSMVSHDFRTPLAVIQASTHILETYDKQLNDDRKTAHFKRILTHIDRMTALLNDVLTISRADAGATPFHPAPLDLDQFCRAVVEEFQNVPTMRHTLVYTRSDEPLAIPADEKLLHQAVVNLLTNAFKYSPEGSTVYLDLAFADQEAEIRVRDSGIGIPLADQPHLFETFHRAGNVGTIEGTGLGLAIVQRSIDAHGGSVTFESQENVGTTFIVTLPLHPKPESEA